MTETSKDACIWKIPPPPFRHEFTRHYQYMYIDENSRFGTQNGWVYCLILDFHMPPFQNPGSVTGCTSEDPGLLQRIQH